MNYPIWELPHVGGGTLIAIIAILHVYISHLAVGGGLFLWLTDLKAVRTKDNNLREYVKKHTWFFLLLTMVFGGMSGVGIWFIIALVQPAATSLLIHNFVFGWAIEWVFFIGEIVALLIYHYRFSKMSENNRLKIAFLYFLFAWLSMVVINGILSFMLTPGQWIKTHQFWDGFLNPTFFSSLAFRTCMAVVIAGLFAYVTAVRMNDSAFRQQMMRYASKWLLFPLVFLVPSAIWYYFSLPDEIRIRSFILNPQMHPFVLIFIATSGLIFIAGILQSLRSPRILQYILTAFFLIIGLGWIGGFEYIREVARKPFVIGNYLYSTSIQADQVDRLNHEGVLANAKWSEIKTIDKSNALKAGQELFRIECMCCHTVGGIRNDILPRIKNYTYLGLVSSLTGQGKIHTYMPPFVGTPEEKEALALYMMQSLNKKQIVTEPANFDITTIPDSIPAFDRTKDQYVLLTWNDLGMHCISDNEAFFSFLPPANTLEGQLIKRGDPPQLIVDESVELSYQVEKGFENPSNEVDFWKYSLPIFGKEIPKNTGLFGKKLADVYNPDAEKRSFIAPAIPVVPYNENGMYNPYPTFTVTAKEKSTGKILMSTRVVTPVSTEMGCRNCHEGGWRKECKSGVSNETAINFLAAHDRLNKTTLLSDAKKGNPALCQSCHADPALGAKGKPEVLNFSSAMHGWHANYIPYSDARACQLCHPSFLRGNTRCLRDLHGRQGIECTQCHGSIAEHAYSLLKGQEEKSPAKALMAKLEVKEASSINPRTPWVNEPDCVTCHKGFDKPEKNASAFNVWNKEMSGLYRMRSYTNGIRCAACHGSTHSVYPSFNSFGKDRDNMQPLQYGNSRAPIGTNGDCEICHTGAIESLEHHHPNMARAFRNADLLK